jgi:hypothetical protein
VTKQNTPDRPSGVQLDHSTAGTDGGDIVGGNKFLFQTISYGSGTPRSNGTDRALPAAQPSTLLPYLTDRRAQLRYIAAHLQTQLDSGLNKPATFFVVGSDDECSDRFFEQVSCVGLPSLLRSNDLPSNIIFRSLAWPKIDEELDPDTIDLSLVDLKSQIFGALYIRTTADWSIFQQKLADSSATCAFYVALNLGEWNQSCKLLLSAWLKWLNQLNLTNVRTPFITVVSLVYRPEFVYRLWTRKSAAVFQRDLRALLGDSNYGGTLQALPELRRVKLSEIELWIREDIDGVDREVLRRIIRKKFALLFGFWIRTLPMYRAAEVVKAALQDPSVRTSIS